MDKHIYYTKGYKYQLKYTYRTNIAVYPEERIETDFTILDTNGDLTVFKGYAWDGPSGPTIDTPNFMRSSLEHDVVYQFLRLKLLDPSWREDADKQLRATCLEDKMSSFRAWYAYHGVNVGGGFAADPKNKKKVYKAP